MKVKCNVLVAIIGLLTMWMTGCAGKVTVTKVPENVPEDKKLQVDGVLYALPRTAVKVPVPVERVESTKGIYADYARLFFPDASKGKEFVEVADDKKTRFSIGKATISTFGEPDPSKLYYVKLPCGA